MIILKEKEWAERMIASCSLGDKPSKTIISVAKYYYSETGSKRETEKKLVEYIKSCDSTMSVPAMQKKIDSAISSAKKYKLIDIDDIRISSKEMETISKLKSIQVKRLAFTLLCLAKYMNRLYDTNNNWIKMKDSEIMSMANIYTSLKRQSDMYRCLEEQGLLTFSKKVDGTSMRVNFIDECDCVCEIDDFRNLGYQYLMNTGEPYFRCVKCGITTKLNNPIKGSHQKYCPECAYKTALQQKVNYAMRRKARLLEEKNQ